MIVSNSGLYNIGLDLRRGLTNKRFWSTLGVLAFVFSLFIGLRGIWPLTTYYYGGDAGYRAYVGRMFTQKIIIQSLISACSGETEFSPDSDSADGCCG